MKSRAEPHTPDSRLLNLYAALSACDKAIIRKTSRTELFDQICRNLVELCDFGLVWIGIMEADQAHIEPVAHFGKGWNYHDWIKLTVEVGPFSGPVSTVVETGQPHWSAHIASDPVLKVMHGLAAQQGWHSAAVVPLTLSERCIGALSLYAPQSQAFNEKERELLLQLASNVSYALDFFAMEQQRKEAEYALLESEVRYSALFANNGVPMLVIDPADGRIVDANIKAIAFYGWDPATWGSMNISEINVMEAAAVQQEMAKAKAAEKSYFEFQHRKASGAICDVEVFSSPISFSGNTYLISAIHDVTERRRLECKVREAQSLTQRFIDHLPGTAFVKDSQLRLLVVNQHLGRTLGVDPQTLIGKTAHDIFPPDFADEVTCLDKQMMAQGGTQTFEENFNGRYNDTSMFVIDDGAGERLLGGLSFDVTDQHRFRERTQAMLDINELGANLSEKEFLTAGLELLEKITRSEIGFLHFVNDDQETLQLITWTAAALRGCTAAYDAHYPVSQAGIWADSLRTHQPAIFNDYAGYPQKHGLPEGHVTMTRIISVPIIEGGLVRMMIGVGNKGSDYDDIDTASLQLMGNDMWRIVCRARVERSLQQRVEELVLVNQKLTHMQMQLLQSEKMASIGQLAAGIAHEINNPVGYIKSNMGTLAGYVNHLMEINRAYEALPDPSDSGFGSALNAIHERKKEVDYDFLMEDLAFLISESREGVERVSKIVLDLKNFSRSSDGTKAWTDLHAGIESTINVVWNQLKYKADVVRKYGELPLVYCVASQINQVVMNLLVNAEQAIAEHGHITITTGVQGDEVWIDVQDDGCGIALEKQARIFEPFFTSKPVGQGTGLGLSIAFDIVQRHRGSLTFQSTPGEGSTFRITLPIEAAVDTPTKGTAP